MERNGDGSTDPGSRTRVLILGGGFGGVWRTYYLFQMPRLERKLRIVLDWTIALLFHYDLVKLDLFGEAHPSGTPRKNRSGAGAG